MAYASTTRRIVLTPGLQRTGALTQSEVQILNNSSNTEIPAVEKAPIAVPINGPRSFSITEPVAGYPQNGPDGMTAFATSGTNPEGEYSPAFDTPLDVQTGTWNPQLNGTYGNFRTVLLQRLADPTREWDKDWNPYITVDRASLDVTTFNGVTSDVDPNVGSSKVNFQTFERGGSNQVLVNADATMAWDGTGSPDTKRMLWPFTQPRAMSLFTGANNSPAEATVNHFFPRQLYHTLGTLNSRYYPIKAGTSPYGGAPDASPSGMPPMGMAFPWPAFNNRPFMNSMELLLVPATNQYGLLANFNVRDASKNEYDNASFGAPYGQLLNFFQSPSATLAGPQFNRIFDFVNVPSPYVQAELYYNSTPFQTGSPAYIDSTKPWTTPAYSYRPPFHKLSRFRDAGRVNINTVFDDTTSTPQDGILQALFRGNPSMDSGSADTAHKTLGTTLISNLRLSRQASTAAVYTIDKTVPSIFNNPFRSQDASDLVPGSSTNPPSVTAGFLRPSTAVPVAAPSTDPPLFAYDSKGTGYDHEDTDRNPYFRYQRFQKIGNLLSTQSNCYAVWITIGYFEVEPYTGAADAAHPDGYSLAQEVGSDAGRFTFSTAPSPSAFSPARG
jgi:hypothetical protein